MAYISFEEHSAEYQELWDTMHIVRDDAELQRVSDKIKQYQDVYEAIQKETGVPWQMIAVIHLREAGEQDIGRWLCVLHDGEKIIGTGRKTRDVPKNRGPFETFQEAAVDALVYQGFDKITDWPVSRMLWALEPYNGYGYRNMGLRSPYLWASTNHQQRGKYVRDHVFDKNVMDTQMGSAALLKYLGVGAPKAAGAGTAAGTIGGGIGSAMLFPPEYTPYIIAGAVATGLLIFLLVRWYRNRIVPKVVENVG